VRGASHYQRKPKRKKGELSALFVNEGKENTNVCNNEKLLSRRKEGK
jgi:hypothetical protein